MIAEKLILKADDLEVLRAFVHDMSSRSDQNQTGRYKSDIEFSLTEIELHREAWVVSELGPIEDGKLKLVTALYAPVGGADGYDATCPVVFWYPDYASDNYENKLSLAHERKMKQLLYFIEKRGRAL